MGAASKQRPVRLELNNSGAWKVITRFDADDDHATNVIQESTYALAKIDTKARWRVCTDAPHPVVLMYCSHDKGWAPA